MTPQRFKYIKDNLIKANKTIFEIALVNVKNESQEKEKELRKRINSIRNKLNKQIEKLNILEERHNEEDEIDLAVCCSLKWALVSVLNDLDKALI